MIVPVYGSWCTESLRPGSMRFCVSTPGSPRRRHRSPRCATLRMIAQCMARGVRTKQLSRKRLPKTTRPSKSCVVHSCGIVGKTGKVRGCGLEGRSRKFQSSANSPILEQSRSNSLPSGLSATLPLPDYGMVARHSLEIARGTLLREGSTGLAALTQAIRVRGIMRKMETKRDAQRMSGIIQRLPTASTKTPPRDNGATTRRFPAADAA